MMFPDSFRCFVFIWFSLHFVVSNQDKFRIQKLNLVWEKATKKLSGEKLKSLYTDLRYQDKEEIALKKLKVENLDKSGSKETMVRGSFNAILMKYGLVEDFKAVEEMFSNKNEESFPNTGMKFVFKDKKLNKLWIKAEKQGFSEDELNMLKEEFEHHQNKIDQYHQLMGNINQGSWHNDDPSNTISQIADVEENLKTWKSDGSPHQILKEKHAALKNGYDHLTSKVNNIKTAEFEEPQVNSLWAMAKNASFTDGELESLRGELHHFEHRLKKVKHLSEMELSKNDANNVVDEELSKRQKKLKGYQYKVDKIEAELRQRIISRHTEL